MHAFVKSGDPKVFEFLKGRIDGALGIVAKRLGTSRFILDDKPTIADLSICGYLFCPVEEFGFDTARDHPAIGAWLERIRALPGRRHPHELMPGHSLTKA